MLGELKSKINVLGDWYLVRGQFLFHLLVLAFLGQSKCTYLWALLFKDSISSQSPSSHTIKLWICCQYMKGQEVFSLITRFQHWLSACTWESSWRCGVSSRQVEVSMKSYEMNNTDNLLYKSLISWTSWKGLSSKIAFLMQNWDPIDRNFPGVGLSTLPIEIKRQ